MKYYLIIRYLQKDDLLDQSWLPTIYRTSGINDYLDAHEGNRNFGNFVSWQKHYNKWWGTGWTLKQFKDRTKDCVKKLHPGLDYYYEIKELTEPEVFAELL